jgi:carboxypeptidase family protein
MTPSDTDDMRRFLALAAVLVCALAGRASAQSIGGSGTIQGTVTDPTGATVPQATVTITNRVTNYSQTVTTGEDGAFQLTNIPPNPYHLEVMATGFEVHHEDTEIRGTVPVSLKIQLALGGGKTIVTVEAGELVENVPYAHNDVSTESLDKLPLSTPGGGMSDAIMLSSGAVTADSNGFFHPLGDHAQTSFSIDGQPISDQQSKNFSTQIPLDAIQSMELITGAPPAEYGDKTSLVVNATTKSGLGQKPTGSLLGEWGSFGTYSEEGTLALGGAKWGNFIAFNALRSGRFLDTPEFMPLHDIGNNGTLFDRFDFQPTGKDAVHLNLFGARNWFQIPDTYDQDTSNQTMQDQRQRVVTYNVAPGYQHTFSSNMVLTIDPFDRMDQVNYYPSANPFNDTPATISQARTLTNWGVKSDLSYVHGRHNIKVGTQLMQTRLHEQFSLGITDPNFPAPPGLAPYDLANGGSLFKFNGSANINQYAFYIQDSIKFGNLSVNAGLRVDQYDGLSKATGVDPRLGLSYLIKPTGTVLRVAYSHTLETPYNENLILSSNTGQGGLATNIFGAFAGQPLTAGTRNQYNAGLEQSIGRWIVVDGDYFWKYTHNAFDFDTLFNTPISFPIEWRKSKLDGVGARISSIDIHGFQWYTTLGHTRARFFGPESGGLIFNSPLDTGVFRIDHDQAFEETTNLRYQFKKKGPWVSFTWRYDSGMVAGAVGTLADVLALTADEQAAIGFFCGGQVAALNHPITSCTGSNYGAARVVIPAPGTENDDHNPARIAPRNLLDAGIGDDNLFHKEHYRTTLKFTVSNITNKEALYNFLSTFSGTHFVEPRSYQVAMGFVF